MSPWKRKSSWFRRVRMSDENDENIVLDEELRDESLDGEDEED